MNQKKDMMMFKRFDTTGQNKGGQNNKDGKDQNLDLDEIAKKNTPFARITGRDQVYKMNAVRHPAPPLGIYNPKIQQRKIPVLFNHQREMMKTGSRVRDVTSSLLDERHEFDMRTSFLIITRHES